MTLLLKPTVTKPRKAKKAVKKTTKAAKATAAGKTKKAVRKTAAAARKKQKSIAPKRTVVKYKSNFERGALSNDGRSRAAVGKPNTKTKTVTTKRKTKTVVRNKKRTPDSPYRKTVTKSRTRR